MIDTTIIKRKSLVSMVINIFGLTAISKILIINDQTNNGLYIESIVPNRCITI